MLAEDVHCPKAAEVAFDVGLEPVGRRTGAQRVSAERDEGEDPAGRSSRIGPGLAARWRAGLAPRGRAGLVQRYPACDSAPAIRSNASRYLLEVRSMIVAGSAGAGGVLSQSRVSR